MMQAFIRSAQKTGRHVVWILAMNQILREICPKILYALKSPIFDYLIEICRRHKVSINIENKIQTTNSTNTAESTIYIFFAYSFIPLSQFVAYLGNKVLHAYIYANQISQTSHFPHNSFPFVNYSNLYVGENEYMIRSYIVLYDYGALLPFIVLNLEFF